MRLHLAPEGNRGDVATLFKISAVSTPAQVLNGDSQVFFKADGVENMPAIHAKTCIG